MDRRNYGSMSATAAVEEDDADPDTEEEEAAGFRACPRLGRGSLAWRLATLLLCLPLCYPCYLSKKTRHHWRRQSSTPKQMLRGRCGHAHSRPHSAGHTPRLSRQSSCRSLGAVSARSSPRSPRAGPEEVRLLVLLSRSSSRLVAGLHPAPPAAPEPGLLGSLDTAVEGAAYRVTLHQELARPRLSQELGLGQLSMVALVYSDPAELREVVGRGGGLLDHLRHYWRGYLPLLLVQLGAGAGPVRAAVLDTIGRDFSSCFRLQLADPCSGAGAAIADTAVRFLLHTDKLQCHKVERTTSSLTSTMTSSLTSQSLVQASWSCPGLCGLRSNQAEQARKKKRSVMDAIRRKISRTE